MKYTDYYAALGVQRGASSEEIKKAYRRLAQKYHPDVSKEADAEARFKEIAEAWQTLKDPEKRRAYDELGTRPQGQEFRPPPDWTRQHGGGDGDFSFEGMDFSDLFSRFGARAGRGGGSPFGGAEMHMPGQDFEVPVSISVEDAFRGTTLDLQLSMPAYDEEGGQLRRTPHNVKARIPPGAVDGQRLRLPGKGGKGHGARDGDLYLDITLKPHPLYRPSGHDLYLDLPLAPWEAALGASVEVPTLAGAVNLKVKPGTSSGQKLRLAGRGLPRPRGNAGDLYAVVQIMVPSELSSRERELYDQLREAASSDPRRKFAERA